MGGGVGRYGILVMIALAAGVSPSLGHVNGTPDVPIVPLAPSFKNAVLFVSGRAFEHSVARDTYEKDSDPNFVTLLGLDVGRINTSDTARDIVVTAAKGKDKVLIWPGTMARDLDPDRDTNLPAAYAFALEPDPVNDQGAAEGPVHVIIVDLNGDGKNDLVVTNSQTNNLSILINDQN